MPESFLHQHQYPHEALESGRPFMPESFLHLKAQE